MSDIVYVKMLGERQGNISAGCGTAASIGNRYQLGHENEIFAFGLSNGMSGTGAGFNLHELSFSKLIDKSSPLLGQGISNNEKYFLEFSLYRISKYGRWEKYYYIELRGATLASITTNFPSNNLDTEVISVRYEYILCKHLMANTEFSYFTLPADYNSLFSIQNPIVATQHFETLNGKGVGRLLAAGGIYNGNVEGFRQTAEQLGGDATAGYEQVLNETTKGIAIAAVSVAAGLGLGRFNAASDIGQLEKLVQAKSIIPEVKTTLEANGRQFSIDALSQSGLRIDPAAKSGSFTVAGRALQKHGSREGSVYPVAKGTPVQINEQGQKMLNSIIKLPDVTVRNGNRFGGFDVISVDGKGSRFDADGNFRGFLEP